MMKVAFTLVFSLLIYTGMAQEPEKNLPKPDFHKIELAEPVIEIQRSRYEQDGVRVKTELSPDGKTIFLHDYDYNSKKRVSILVKFADGRVEDLIRYFCNIEPVYLSFEL